MKTKRTNDGSGGFTLVEVMLVVAIIGRLAAIALPNFIKSRAKAQANACINNLRQIESGCQQFSIANNLGPGAIINYPTDVASYVKLNSSGSIPPCPAGGTYSLLAVGANPQSQCSLSNIVNPAHILQ